MQEAGPDAVYTSAADQDSNRLRYAEDAWRRQNQARTNQSRFSLARAGVGRVRDATVRRLRGQLAEHELIQRTMFRVRQSVRHTGWNIDDAEYQTERQLGLLEGSAGRRMGELLDDQEDDRAAVRRRQGYSYDDIDTSARNATGRQQRRRDVEVQRESEDLARARFNRNRRNNFALEELEEQHQERLAQIERTGQQRRQDAELQHQRQRVRIGKQGRRRASGYARGAGRDLAKKHESDAVGREKIRDRLAEQLFELEFTFGQDFHPGALDALGGSPDDFWVRAPGEGTAYEDAELARDDAIADSDRAQRRAEEYETDIAQPDRLQDTIERQELAAAEEEEGWAVRQKRSAVDHAIALDDIQIAANQQKIQKEVEALRALDELDLTHREQIEDFAFQHQENRLKIIESGQEQVRKAVLAHDRFLIDEQLRVTEALKAAKRGEAGDDAIAAVRAGDTDIASRVPFLERPLAERSDPDVYGTVVNEYHTTLQVPENSLVDRDGLRELYYQLREEDERMGREPVGAMR